MYRTLFTRLMPYMDADDGTSLPNADETSAEEMEVAEPSESEESEEEQEVAEPADEDESSKSDAAFAQMRREKQELERRIAELETERDEYNDTLGLFFDGDDKIAQAKAHYEGISVEEAKSAIAREREDKSLKRENEELKDSLNELKYKQQKAEDLAEILAAHPDANIKDVEELGDDFFAYRVQGITANQAFEGIQMKKSKPPKSMGKVKTAPAEKSFYTQEEVAGMSRDEVHKNYDKIRASMSKWK